MNKEYLDLAKACEANKEQLPENLSKLYDAIQRIILLSYQYGYADGKAHNAE